MKSVALLFLVTGAAAAADAPGSWEEARARAATTGDLLLVEVGAPWCHACNLFELRTLGDERVTQALGEGWIFVEIDVDRRPDLHRLFHARGHDGLPTLHFLDEKGRELLRTSPLGPEEMVETLAYVRRARGSGIDLLPPRDEARVVAVAPEALFEAARATLFTEADPAHAGFGRSTKYLVLPETDFLLELARAGDARASGELTRLLDAVLASPLRDRVAGGVHRYSETRDWSSPHYEKLLSVQAVVVDALGLDARWAPLAADRRDQISRILEFLDDRLLDRDTGLVFASVNADVLASDPPRLLEPGESYYAREGGHRLVTARTPAGSTRSQSRRTGRAGPAPSIDAALFTGANARLAAALIRAGRTLDRHDWDQRGRSAAVAIGEHLRDEEGRLLRWRSATGSGLALAEDHAELGLLLLETGDLAQATAEAEILASRLARIADLGEDGARTLVFLARLGRALPGSPWEAQARTLLPALVGGFPEPAPAAVGLAAGAIAGRL